MILYTILFIIGILGFVLNRKNIIMVQTSLYVILLPITFLILVNLFNLDDIVGQAYAICPVYFEGMESTTELDILVAYYRLRENITINYN